MQRRKQTLPDPSRDILRCWILEAFDLIQAMMVESLSQGAECRLDIEEVDNKARARIHRPFDSNLDPIGVPVHAMASVVCGHVWQTMRSLESEGLRNSHRIPIALWV